MNFGERIGPMDGNPLVGFFCVTGVFLPSQTPVRRSSISHAGNRKISQTISGFIFRWISTTMRYCAAWTESLPFIEKLNILVRWNRTSGNLGIRCPEVEIIYVIYEFTRVMLYLQIPLHRITDFASNGSVFPVVTEHFSASSDHAFL